MSPVERFRRCTLAPVLVRLLRDGLTLTATAPGADAREVEEAAADYLEAGLAEPAPVAGVSAEERALLRALAGAATEAERAALNQVLAALDAAEARAAQAERERDAARGDRSWIRYEYEGGMHTAAELVALAKERHGLKITRAQMVARMYHGWPVDRAIKTPVGRNAAG